MRWALLILLFALAFPVAAPAYAAGEDDLNAAIDALVAKDYPTAERRADAAIKSGDLKGERLGLAHYLRGLARWDEARREHVLEDFNAAARLIPPGNRLWPDIIENRIRVLMGLKRWREAASDFILLAKERPADAKNLDFDVVARLAWRLEGDDQTALALLRTIKAIGYTPKSPGHTMDGLMGMYVRLLVQGGQTNEAIAELAKITDASTLIATRIDRRYAALWPLQAFDQATNPAEIAKRELAFWETRHRLHPTAAKVITRYVMALRQAGEHEKAIATARKALADPSALESEKDEGDELWLRNELVYALKDVGKIDEMLTEMATILLVDPAKDSNIVNQLINFGEILLELGRTREGVDMSKRARSQSSDFGKMFIQGIEVCANATTDRAAAEQTLAAMRKMEKENYAAVSQALLCLEKSDDMAALVKKRLAEPDARQGVLTAVQKYNYPPFVTPLRKTLMERYQAVIARPDIRAAIEQHGRVETFPFIAPYWGDL